MQIQLKQTEIIQALKLYITTQGINLNGKSVEVSFTAGRKDSGLTADVQIEDVAGNAVVGMGSVSMPPHILALKNASEAIDRETAEVIAEFYPEIMEEEVPVEEEAVAPAKGTSLFG